MLLVGFHYGIFPASFMDMYYMGIKNFVSRFSHKLKESASYDNTRALIKAMDNYPIDIITHPGAKVDIDTAVIANAAVKKGVALEINSHHEFMTAEYVRIAKSFGARFVLSSDAHKPEDVGRMDNAIKIALQAGLTEKDIINVLGGEQAI